MYLEKLDFSENIKSEMINCLMKVLEENTENHDDFLKLFYPEKIDKNRKLLAETYIKSTFSDELNDIKIFEDYCSEINKPSQIIRSPLTKVILVLN